MRIDYEIDSDDFADASIAAALGRQKPRIVSGKPFLPPWVLWAVVAGVVVFLVFLILFFVPAGGWPQSDSTDSPGLWLVNWVARYEWLVLWIPFGLASFVSLSSKRGRRAYRVASLANLIVFVALAALVVMSRYQATERSPVAEVGAIGVVLWALVFNLVWPPVSFAWTSTLLRTAYERSWYVGEPRVMTFEEEHVRDESPSVAARFHWSVLSRVETTSRTLLLFNKGGQLVSFLPLRAIGDAQAVSALVEMIRSRLGGGRVFEVVPIAAEVAPETIQVDTLGT